MRLMRFSQEILEAFFELVEFWRDDESAIVRVFFGIVMVAVGVFARCEIVERGYLGDNRAVVGACVGQLPDKIFRRAEFCASKTGAPPATLSLRNYTKGGVLIICHHFWRLRLRFFEY